MNRLLPLLFIVLTIAGWATGLEKRVKFARGASEATITGTWDPAKAGRGESFDRYILGAAKGQTMTVRVEASGESSLYVWHSDYNNGNLADGTGKTTSCTVKLPANGDYNVDIGPSGENPKKFTYKVTFSIR